MGHGTIHSVLGPFLGSREPLAVNTFVENGAEDCLESHGF
jgi:hypothetical protein